MAKQREENSLFLSLKEVQNLVEDRVREEEEAKRAAEEAERRSREDAIRRVQEEEEARIQAEQLRIQQEQEARERQHREEQLRLEESERRARIEAQARLEEARIRAEAEAIATKPLPWPLIIGLTTGLLIAAGGTIFAVKRHNEQVRAEELARIEARQAEIQAQIDKERKEDDERQRALLAQFNDLEGKFRAAKDKEERRRLAEQAAEANRRLAQAKADADAHAKLRAEQMKKEKLAKCLKDPSDPLCGI